MPRLVIILVFCILASNVISQNNSQSAPKNFYAGFKAGINYSRLNSDTADLDFRAMPLAGIYGRYRVYKNIFINSSLLYSSKSSKCASPNFRI